MAGQLSNGYPVIFRRTVSCGYLPLLTIWKDSMIITGSHFITDLLFLIRNLDRRKNKSAMEYDCNRSNYVVAIPQKWALSIRVHACQRLLAKKLEVFTLVMKSVAIYRQW
jgi:hypothetical protein